MSARADQATELLGDAGLDLLLVSSLVNVRYLTGYTGSNGIALVGPSTRTFITDFRYVEQSAREVDSAFDRRRAAQELLDSVGEVLPDGALALGFEDDHMSVREHAQLREMLPERIELIGVNGMVESLRAVKDRDEIERIKGAAEIADAALQRLLEGGLVGRSERELALELEQVMRLLGAQRPSFDSIVAAGGHGALPHATPRDVEVGRGEMVVIDWGAELDGYCSDCTRTVAAGEPGDEATSVYALVLEAQVAGLGAIKAGAAAREVDAVARNVITAGGHGERFGHGLGHGVGLEIHEGPRLSRRSEDELRAGNAVTVEPGVYLVGEFGVRIEDLVVVNDGGCDILTSIGKDLMVVD
jgi:Xaa-Pro aminopeptidase